MSAQQPGLWRKFSMHLLRRRLTCGLYLIASVLPLSMPAAFAATDIVAESILVVGFTDYKTLLRSDKDFRAVETRLDNRVFRWPVYTRVENVALKYERKFTLTADRENAKKLWYSLVLKQPSVQIGKVVTDGFITIRDRNGREIKIRQKAECNDLRARFLGNQIRLTGYILIDSENNKIKLKVENGDTLIRDNLWATETGPCDEGNIRNYKELAARKLDEFLRDEFKIEISDALTKEIEIGNEQLNSRIFRNLTLGSLRGTLSTYSPKELFINDNGAILLKGEIRTNFNSGKKTRKIRKLRVKNNLSNMEDISDSQLIVPRNYLSVLLREFHKNGLIREQFRGSEFKEFADIREGGLKRWIVWADLGEFEDDVRFDFDVRSFGEGPRLGRAWSVPGGLFSEAEVEFQIRTYFQYPRRRRQNYVTFYTRQAADVCLQFTDRGLEFQFGNIKKDWHYRWAKNYEPVFDDIDIKSVSEAFQGKLQSLTAVLPFRPLTIEDRLTIRPHRVVPLQGDWSILLTQKKSLTGKAKRCREFFQAEN